MAEEQETKTEQQTENKETKPVEKDPETESALSLYRALKDPDLSSEVIESLARRAGLLDGKKETEKSIEGKITSSLKKKLGKDYEKFSDMVGPILDEAIQDFIEERLTKEKSSGRVSGWEKEVDRFINKWDLESDVEDTMREIIEDSPPNFESKRFDPQKYLERIYKSACSELGKETKAKGSSKKPSKRKVEFEDDEEFSEIEEREAPKGVTVDDAIEAAMKGIRFKHKS